MHGAHAWFANILRHPRSSQFLIPYFVVTMQTTAGSGMKTQVSQHKKPSSFS